MNSEASATKRQKADELSKAQVTEKLIEAIKAVLDAIHSNETGDRQRFREDTEKAVGILHKTRMDPGGGPGAGPGWGPHPPRNLER